MKFTQKLLCASLMLATATAASASFYGGVGVGIRPLSCNFTNLDLFGVKVSNLNESVTRPAADFFVGYKHLFQNNLFLGVEAYYEHMDMSATVSATVQPFDSQPNLSVQEKLSAELDYNAGLGLFFGYKVHNDDIFYARVGAIYDMLYYKAVQSALGQVQSTTHGMHDVGAAQLGLGVMHPFTKHWSLRGEYTYTRYPTEKVTIHTSVPTIGPVQIVSFTPQVAINAVTLSAIYTFG
jgi:hypothetical protein